MKEKEAKKLAAKRRLEEEHKRKAEEENALRKGEALQVGRAATSVHPPECWARVNMSRCLPVILTVSRKNMILYFSGI